MFPTCTSVQRQQLLTGLWVILADVSAVSCICIHVSSLDWPGSYSGSSRMETGAIVIINCSNKIKTIRVNTVFYKFYTPIFGFQYTVNR